jgi:hypothetical protein
MVKLRLRRTGTTIDDGFEMRAGGPRANQPSKDLLTQI